MALPHWKIVTLIFIMACATALYLPSLNFPFVWDDHGQIKDNRVLQSPNNLGLLLRSSTFDDGSGVLHGAFYRPMVSLSYFLNYHIWGLDPRGYRLFQLLIHVLNLYLVYAFVIRFLTLRNVKNAATIALGVLTLYAMHPVLVESVAFMGSLGEVLYTFFTLLGLHAMLHASIETVPRWLTTLSFSLFTLLALLSKESAIVVLGIAVLYFCLFRKSRPRYWAHLLIASLLSIGTYLLIRLGIARLAFTADYHSFISGASFLERLMTIPYVLMHYISTLFMPVRLLIYQDTVVSHPASILFWGYLAGLLIIIVGVWFLIRHHIYKRELIFFAGWFLIGLVPVLNIVGIDMTIADRWLYFPAIGYWGFTVTYIGTSMHLEAIKKYIAVGLFVVYATALAGRTTIREYDWRSDYALFSHDVQFVHANPDLINNYAFTLIQRGNFITAIDYLHAALKLQPDHLRAKYNLGTAYTFIGRIDLAELQYLDIINASASLPSAYSDLAILYINARQFEKAVKVIERAELLYPQYDAIKVLRALSAHLDSNYASGIVN